MTITHLDKTRIYPVSTYKDFTRDTDIQTFLNTVKSPPPDLINTINAIRAEQDEDKRKALKSTLPAVTISAHFPETRKAISAGKLTGLLQIDIDKYPDPAELKARLCNDPHTLACFISPSGRGVKVIARTDPKATDEDGSRWKNSEHKQLFNNAEIYYNTNFNVQIDKSCSDISRCMYYSYDPDIFINLDAPPLLKIEKTKVEPAKKTKRVPAKVNQICEQIEASGKSLDYDTRLKMGMALVNEYGDQGRDLFHKISRNHENYDAENYDKKLTEITSASRGEVKIGSFFHIAKEQGFTPDKNEDLMNAIIKLKIKYNEVTGEYEIPMQESLYPDDKRTIYAPLRDKMENTIYVQLKNEGLKITIHDMRTHIQSDFGAISYNPFIEYLDSIRHMQNPETPALNQVLASLPVKDARILPFVKKWLLSIISTMHGNASDILLVFCGGQGTGKTVFFETLLPPVLLKYYTTSTHEGTKDDLILMSRTLICLDDEYHGRSKRDSEKIKAILSQKEFTIRASYARNHEARKRYAVLCGTSNISEIKFDITGNRRIVPVELTGKIDRSLYTSKIYSDRDSPNRDQLFSDLLYIYEQDPNQWKINGNDAKLLNEITAENEAHSIEADFIYQCFRSAGSDGERWLSIAQIVQHIEKETGLKIDTPSRNKFTLILRKMGYIKTRKREANKARTDAAVWGYYIAPVFGG